CRGRIEGGGDRGSCTWVGTSCHQCQHRTRLRRSLRKPDPISSRRTRDWCRCASRGLPDPSKIPDRDLSLEEGDAVADRELQKGEATDWGIVDGTLKAANESAKDAAPFLHPRLSAVEHTGNPVDAFTEILKLIDGTRDKHFVVMFVGAAPSPCPH